MSFKPKWILLKTFFESQFEVIYVYEFQTKANSYEDICLVSFWSYVSLWIWNQSEFSWRYLLSVSLKLHKFIVSNKSEFLRRYLLSLSLKLFKFTSFKQKPNSYEDICCVSASSYLSLWVSNKIELLWRHFLSFRLKLCKFMSFKPKHILMKTFFESQFEVL